MYVGYLDEMLAPGRGIRGAGNGIQTSIMVAVTIIKLYSGV
jgi:hypothetical protein